MASPLVKTLGALKKAMKSSERGGDIASYVDPASSRIADWQWKPMQGVASQIDTREVPDYIQRGFGEFMADQLKRAQRGEMGPRDLIKAYTITRSSVNRGSLPHSTATKTGMKLPATSGPVRPEGAFSEWLGSPEGQRYLDAAERGEIDAKAIEGLQQKFSPFGMPWVLSEDMKWAAKNFPKREGISEMITADPAAYRELSQNVPGIGPAKSGFMGAMLGRGDFPTLDARQLRLHTEGGGKEASKFMKRGKGEGGEEAVARLTARQNALDMGIDPELDPFYQHLVHHTIWDKVGNEQTTHDDLVRAMRGYAGGGQVEPHMAGAGDVAKALARALKASEALGGHEGKRLFPTQSDRTKVGGKYLGGPGFSSLQLTDPLYEQARAVWGVGEKAAASKMINAAQRAEEPVVWTTMIGSPEQHRSNQQVFDELLKSFRSSAKQGNLTPELRAKMNARLSAPREKDEPPVFEEGVDILDPKFRQIADTFDKRAHAASIMSGEGVGGKKGQIFDYDKILRMSTDPMLTDVPTFAMGPRLFELHGDVVHRPDLHPGYPVLLTGKDFGVEFEPIPRDVMLRDFVEDYRKSTGKEPGTWAFTRKTPSQFLSEDFLTGLQKAGYKQGGPVTKSVKKRSKNG
jgi:hypothetical protein